MIFNSRNFGTTECTLYLYGGAFIYREESLGTVIERTVLNDCKNHSEAKVYFDQQVLKVKERHCDKA